MRLTLLTLLLDMMFAALISGKNQQFCFRSRGGERDQNTVMLQGILYYAYCLYPLPKIQPKIFCALYACSFVNFGTLEPLQ